MDHSYHAKKHGRHHGMIMAMFSPAGIPAKTGYADWAQTTPEHTADRKIRA